MPRSRSVPSYRLHKPTGQAVVTIRTPEGVYRDVYLGKHDSPDSRREYARIIAEMASSPVVMPAAVPAQSTLTIDQVLLAFWRWATTHYRTPMGNPRPRSRV